MNPRLEALRKQEREINAELERKGVETRVMLNEAMLRLEYRMPKKDLPKPDSTLD
jgi:hypothetical protein